MSRVMRDVDSCHDSGAIWVVVTLARLVGSVANTSVAHSVTIRILLV